MKTQGIDFLPSSSLRRFGQAILFALIFAFFIFLPNKTWATFTQDDDAGTAIIDLSKGESTGIADDANIYYSSTFAALLPGSANGSLLTSGIQPNSFKAWKNLTIEGDYDASQVKVQLYTCDATPKLIPDSALAGNSAGLSLNNKSLDLSGLDNQAYQCLKAKVLLSAGDEALSAPAISKIDWAWSPKSAFLLTITGPTSAKSGTLMTYNLNYSVSYVYGDHVILYLPLPDARAGSFTTAYNQQLQLKGGQYSTSSNGGAYTASAITVDGVNIPANSVYWNLGVLQAGTAGSVTASIWNINGTENGVWYDFKAYITSQTASATTAQTGTQITSAPQPTLTKNVSNVVPIDGVNHVVMSAPYNGNVNFKLTLANSWAAGTTTLFQPAVKDDLSTTCSFLTNQCGVNNCAERITNISNGGVLNGNNLTWQSADIAPNGSKDFTFTVNFSGCPDGAIVNNNAYATGINYTQINASAALTTGLDSRPQLSIAKGDITRFPGNNLGATANDDNNAPPNPTNISSLEGKTAYGDTTTYLLKVSNTGPVRVDNIVLMDKIAPELDLVSLKVPGVAGARFYFAQSVDYTDPATPPTFDADNPDAPGTVWSEIPPTNLSSVTWVAVWLPCLKSSYFNAEGSCASAPSTAQAEILVRAKTLSSSDDQCKTSSITNTVTGYATKAAVDPINQADSNVQPIPEGPILLNDGNEKTWLTPGIPSFNTNTSISGPSALQAGQIGSYTLTVKNEGLALAVGTKLTINIPKLTIGGVVQYLDFVDFQGSPYSFVYANDKISQVVADVGNLGVGATKNFTLQLAIPRGITPNINYTVNATATAQDLNGCATPSKSFYMWTALQGNPQINIFEGKDESSTAACGDIHFKYDFDSRGTISTSDTYILTKIPDNTIFAEAYTNGTSLDDHLNNYTCKNCQVYFSKNVPPLPGSISVNEPMTTAMIKANFTLGVETSPGVWQPPINLPKDQVIYVAYLIDDKTLPSHLLYAGQMGRVGLKATNYQADGENNCSSLGTLISNYPAIVSNETVQAIGNTVVVPILDSPGLTLNKSSSVETITAGEIFDYYLDYQNTSSLEDVAVTLTDTLPAGLTLLGITNQWNNIAIGNGLPVNEMSLNSSQYALTNLGSGGQSLVIKVAPDLRGGSLLNYEGGRIKLRVQASDNLTSGFRFINSVEGCYSAAIGDGTCVNDDNLVTVDNPDLWLRKMVSNTKPVEGEKLVYSLIVVNKGRHEAPNVELSDVLPAGLCFSQMMATSPSNWSLGTPQISGGNCATQPTTLTWNQSLGNAIQNINAGTMANIPGNSEEITIRYEVEVRNAPAGTVLTNNALVTTTLPEDPNYPNNGSQQVIVPDADPYVTKNVSANSVVGGEVFDYEISYGNFTAQEATGVYLIDELPLAKVLAASSSHGEQIYFYDQNHAPALDTLGISASYNFLANSNFKASPLSFDVSSYPTHMVMVVGSTLAGNAGPNKIHLTMQAVNPLDNTRLHADTSLLNKVTIYSSSVDLDLTNNYAQVETSLPAINLKMSKTAVQNIVVPGTTAEFDLRVDNNGQSPVCGVWVTDVLPAELSNLQSSLSAVELKDGGDQTMLPINTVGEAITSIIPVDFDSQTNTWYFGGRTNYNNVCWPSGAHQTWRIKADVSPFLESKIQLTNTATVGQDGGDTEDFLNDNTATANVATGTVDLAVGKKGQTCGTDATCSNLGSESEIELGDYALYSITYGNLGDVAAQDTIIMDVLDHNGIGNNCLVVDSFVGVPSDAELNFSADDGQTWNYAPTGSEDCRVTNWQVILGEALAPTEGLSEIITFRTHIDQSTFSNFIPNSVAISTSDPQTNYNNDHASHIFSVPQTNLALTKNPVQGVFMPDEITAETEVNYVINLKNLGPSPAKNPVLTDFIPPELTFEPQVVTGVGKNSGIVYTFDCQVAEDKLICTGDKSIEYLADIDLILKGKFTDVSSLVNGTQISNMACVKSSYYDQNNSLNCDTTVVEIGQNANLTMAKSSFSQPYLGGEMNYILRVGNNGNLAAEDWNIVDSYDENLEILSFNLVAEQSSSDFPIDLVCTNDASQHQFTCQSTSNAIFPIGAIGYVEVKAKIGTELTPADKTIIHNTACIYTSTAQSRTEDDCSSANKSLVPMDNSLISGRVLWAGNYALDFINNTDRLAAAIIYLTGYDVLGNIYGPATDAIGYTQVMDDLRDELIRNNIVRADITNEEIAALPNFKIKAEVVTAADGEFAFTDLTPGIYSLYQVAPEGYVVLGSQDGETYYNDDPAAVIVQNLNNIVLQPNQSSVNNLFLDALAKLSGKVWHDKNKNNVFDADDKPLSNARIEVRLNGEVVYVVTTDNDGNYVIDALAVLHLNQANEDRTALSDPRQQEPAVYSLSLDLSSVPNNLKLRLGDGGYIRSFSATNLISLNNNFALVDVNTDNPGGNNGGGDNGGSGGDNPGPQVCAVTKPGSAPTIDHAQMTSPTQITLFFKEGQAPFDRFIVRYGLSPDAMNYGTTINDGGTRSIQINDLQPNVKYYFQIAAVNDCAPGDWSNTFSIDGVKIKQAAGDWMQPFEIWSKPGLLKTGQNIWKRN